MAMSEGWNNIYNSDNSFFGEEPSDFALLCLNQMMSLDVKRVLELGAGHGRDAIFFASNGLEVEALDYSDRGIEILNKKAQEKSCRIDAKPFDIKQSLPFPNASFDAVYSHMLLDMKFSKPELRLIFSEISRVLKPNGLNFFSVRNYRDRFYGKGIEVQEGIYNVNGFEVRFFTDDEIRSLSTEENFYTLWLKEEYEEPVTLYIVASIKMD